MIPVALVADDSHDIADALVELIRFIGYEAVAAYDGQEAVDLCTTFRPRLVILDINMPVLDGCQAAKAMRDTNVAPHFLIAHTALQPSQEPLRSSPGLFHMVVSKPVDFEVLDMLVHEALSGATS